MGIRTLDQFSLSPAIGTGGLPNFMDWSAYNTLYNWSGTRVLVPAQSWHTFLDETGEGYLIFARAFGRTVFSDRPDIRVTLDGQIFLVNGVGTNGGGRVGNTIFNFYFAKSIKIEVFNRDTSSQDMGLDYTLLKKVSEPDSPTVLRGVVNQYQHSVTSTSAVDVVNITGAGYLIAALFTPYHNIAYSTTGLQRATITVDSTVIMNNRDVYSLISGVDKLSLFLGPIRFENDLVLQHSTSNSNLIAVTQAWVVLDGV